jgi:hypothetical protein
MALALLQILVSARLDGRVMIAQCQYVIRHVSIMATALIRILVRVKEVGLEMIAVLLNVHKNARMAESV